MIVETLLPPLRRSRLSTLLLQYLLSHLITQLSAVTITLWMMLALSDSCGEVIISVEATITPGSCTGDYTISRVFTATDDCGNSTSATQTITIIDTTAPVLTIPSDYTAECSDDHPMDDASATG